MSFRFDQSMVLTYRVTFLPPCEILASEILRSRLGLFCFIFVRSIIRSSSVKMNRIWSPQYLKMSLATFPQIQCFRKFCAGPHSPLSTQVKSFQQRHEQHRHRSELDIDWNFEMQVIHKEEQKHSLLDLVQDEYSVDVEPTIGMSFNLAAYASKSPTLQELLKLGVSLYKIERRKGQAEFLLSLDFEKNMKDHIFFLTKVVGMDASLMGAFITKNPEIFRENIDDLQTRVNYLKSKKFKPNEITSIVETDPFWLMFSTRHIDERLGFFQREFRLSGDQVRALTISLPKIITSSFDGIRELTFSIREELELTKEETRSLLLKQPDIWLTRNFLFS